MTESRQLLRAAQSKLEQAGISTARLDTLALAEHTYGISRSLLIAGTNLPSSKDAAYNQFIEQRAQRNPLAYLIGSKEFFGHQFFIQPSVLIPRPESEGMVTLALSLELSDNHLVVDVGCGSGCLGISYVLAYTKQRPQLHLVDVSPDALLVAKRNAKVHQIEASYHQQNLLSNKQLTSIDLVLANLPYVPTTKHQDLAAASPELDKEPELALYGGPDGLDLYRQLFKQLATARSPATYVIAEALPDQHQALAKIAQDAHYKLAQMLGLALLFTKA